MYKKVESKEKGVNIIMIQKLNSKEYKGTSQYLEVKKGWHNFVLKKPLKRK